ncbi:MAG: hypothetical protein JNL08_19445 [Planctomycetes bacterium]|nr:hypothetical protein [Planctomycetota bacterium]
MTARRAVIAWLVAAGLAAQDEPAGAVAAPHPADARVRELVALQQRGELDVATVLAALGCEDETVGATAAAIVRHGWPELPPALLQGLDADRRAAQRFLLELAWAPRPAAADWVAARCGEAPGRTADERLLALAARGVPLAAADVDLLLATAVAGDVGIGWHLALGLLPAPRADGLASRLHGLLQQQRIDAATVVPFLDRMSPRGAQHLLGVVAVLPAELADELSLLVAQRAPAAVQERARAALDGETPLEVRWLRFAVPLLDRAERRERLLAVLADATAARDLQQAAFTALVDARFVDARVIDWALAHAETADGAADLARLLDAAVDLLPAPLLAAWLEGEPTLAARTVRALVRRPELGAELERTLLRLLDGGPVAGTFLEPAATAVLQRGSEAAVRALWPTLRRWAPWDDLVEALARRRAPFAHELLLLELDAPIPDGLPAAARERQLDCARLGLVVMGDRRQLAVLVDHAKAAEPVFVRRCAHYARPLPGDLALQLLEGLAAVDDPDLAGELAAWAATSTDPGVADWLQRAWQSPATDDRAVLLREVALRALAAGPGRALLCARLQAGPDDGLSADAREALPFELIATMPDALAADDLRLLAELVLRPPLSQRQREPELVHRWPDGRHGFPLVTAVGQRLLGADPVAAGAAFTAVASTAAAAVAAPPLSRQRFLVLWRTLLRDRDVLLAVGAATAPVCLALPDDGTAFASGPAHWLSYEAAVAGGDHAAAIAHARAAIAGLLWAGDDAFDARRFLGEREPAAGLDPWAALAAAPWLQALAAARAAGDAAGAARAAATACEFAGHDAATRAALLTSADEDPNR